MKIKAVLRSLFLAYALTGICLLLLAFLVFQMDIGTGPVTVGIIVIYVISCMAGGFLAGKITRREKYRWGALVGLSFHTFGNCFFYRERKLGYEPGTYDNNVLYVPWRRHSWRHAILRKKCF